MTGGDGELVNGIAATGLLASVIEDVAPTIAPELKEGSGSTLEEVNAAVLLGEVTTTVVATGGGDGAVAVTCSSEPEVRAELDGAILEVAITTALLARMREDSTTSEVMRIGDDGSEVVT